MWLGVIVLGLTVLVVVGASAWIKTPLNESFEEKMPRRVDIDPADWPQYGSPSPYEYDPASGKRQAAEKDRSDKPDPRLFAETPNAFPLINAPKVDCTFLKNRGLNATMQDQSDAYTDIEQHRIHWGII